MAAAATQVAVLDVQGVAAVATQVAVLDGTPVTPKEKVLAANMHGAAAEPLRAIRRRHFPHGELDDHGGTIPPPSAGLVASMADEERADPGGWAAAALRVDAFMRVCVLLQVLACSQHL